MEEVTAPPGHNKDLSPIAKGKRTKRHKPHSPIPFTIKRPAIALSSPDISTSSSSKDSTTTEEEDTARCLILLARGHFPSHPPSKPHDHHHHENSKNKRYVETATNIGKAVGSTCMYTCKTCNRAFTSFQALGGHRASHKKPKNEKKRTLFSDEEDFPSPSSISSSRNRMSSNSLSLQLSNISTATFSATPKSSPSPRMHECTYCGAEFTSGQALGGHMRRHRAGPISPTPNMAPTTASVESKNLKNVLSLDLNLPAPEDDNQRFRFACPRQQKSLKERQQPQNEAASQLSLSTTTTPTLVDCHY
ncbi:hypothetical protein RD792_000303 [Penstemon davidsonii]|uniref:C2H2-type domain-containing protein n=1 Tax=Penstemon davidsonii TaxID=160366 RepID=A0ABR0DUS1_9LAMI|nr:hypothetical protein RD792_000303 [Penstemon davidsonii]